MKIHLRDRNPEMVKAWKVMWKPADKDIEISEGDIFDGPITDAIVSPANSWGFLDGGIDAVYSHRWPHLQAKLQKHLAENFYGELPVGCATIIPIHDGQKKEDFNWLISAPTMRIPQNVQNTVNAYLAFRASLIEVLRYNHNLSLNYHLSPIETILCPGMGTAIGRMPHQIAALQMYHAWKRICIESLELGDDLTIAWNNHEFLRRGLI